MEPGWWHKLVGIVISAAVIAWGAFLALATVGVFG